jgi:hypothetical protein
MDAKSLLADLLEVSGQVEAAAIVTRAGEVVAGTDEESASALGTAIHSLAGSANDVSGPTDQALVQLQVSLSGSCVFIAQDEQHSIGCVTVPHPTAGLVFYDLKSTLRRLAGDHDDLVPKPIEWDGADKPDAGSDA